MYRSALLGSVAWVQHGFGTRHSADWLAGELVDTVHQIHSDRVAVAEGRGDRLGDADAIVSNRPGVMIAIRTADCVSILIADPVQKAVAAVHAGWRGTVAGIAERTIEALQREYGSRAQDLLVAVGPAIGACCFEVGPEVAVQFRSLFSERSDLEGRARLDLLEGNRRQLLRSGVRDGNFDVLGRCSMCEPDEFHSHRRDRESSGRMTSAIGIRG